RKKNSLWKQFTSKTLLHTSAKLDIVYRIPILHIDKSYMYLSEYYYTIEGVDEIEDKIILFFSFCDWIYVVCVVFWCWESYFSSGIRTSIGNKSFTSDCWVFNYRNGFTTLRSTSHCLFR